MLVRGCCFRPPGTGVYRRPASLVSAGGRQSVRMDAGETAACGVDHMHGGAAVGVLPAGR